MTDNISETASLKSGKRSIRTCVLVNGLRDVEEEIDPETDLAELHSVYWIELAHLIDLVAHVGFTVSFVAIMCRYFSLVQVL